MSPPFLEFVASSLRLFRELDYIPDERWWGMQREGFLRSRYQKESPDSEIWLQIMKGNIGPRCDQLLLFWGTSYHIKAYLDELLACVFWKILSPTSNILSPYHPTKSPTENPCGKGKERWKSHPGIARLWIGQTEHKAKIEITPRKDVKRSFTVSYNLIVTWLHSDSSLGRW